MEIKWKTEESGCIVPVSHKLNKDGYFRKRINGKLMMYHRYIWEMTNYEIPEGHEINHLCKNRACSNVCHLECISGLEHTIKTNKERYADRKLNAEDYWISTNCSGTRLAEEFNISVSTACGWIREWVNYID